ncbi:MAG: UpxY family transcription antiterminator [Bacteroidales bacterium]|nr:UpxY family transcription antiterminator [Bacteroidales bacterium]
MATVESAKTDIDENNNRQWYVGIVSPRHEKKIADNIRQLGYEAFVPVQTVTRTWSQGRKRDVEVVLIPAKIFVFLTNDERLKLLRCGLGLRYYLVNICGKVDELGRRPLAIVPRKQMECFQLMLDKSPSRIDIVENQFVQGDKVKVVSGPLEGLEGIVKWGPENKTRIYIVLDTLGSASTEIDVKDIEIMKTDSN